MNAMFGDDREWKNNIYLQRSVFVIPLATKLRGEYWIHPVCLSVRLSICWSVCLSVCLFVRKPFVSALSTVQDGFFPYLVQMINSMRGCVTCDDTWPWLISSRSFGLDSENCVRSVASTVLDGIFSYSAQMITIIRGCVKNFGLDLEKNIYTVAQMVTNMRGCFAYNDLWPWPISIRSFGLGLENCVRSVASTVLDGFFPYLKWSLAWCVSHMMTFDLDLHLQNLRFCLHSFHIWHKSSSASEGVLHVMTFDLYLQGHSTLTLKIVSAL